MVPVSVRVVGAGSTPIGPVRVVMGDRLVASGLLVEGRVRLSVDSASLGVGPHVLRMLYDGDATHRSSATIRRGSRQSEFARRFCGAGKQSGRDGWTCRLASARSLSRSATLLDRPFRPF